MHHPTQSLIYVIRILHIMHSSTQLDTTPPEPLTTASLPTIIALRFLARTLDIPTTHDILTHPQPDHTQYQHAYSQAATTFPCPPRHNTRQCHPNLCQFCAQLAKPIQNTITKHTPTPMRYPTCNITPHTSNHHILCASCIAFALLTQNVYANRWNTILAQSTPIHTTPLTPMTPTHTFPTPYPLTSTHTHHQPSPPPQQSTTPSLQLQFALPSHIITAATKILQPFLLRTNHNITHTHHPTMPLTSTHMHTLANQLRHTHTHPLNETVLFHYFTTISRPADCQPHRRLFLHLNQLTHALLSYALDQHTEQVTIHLHLTSNNPYVTYISGSPDKHPATTLIHLEHVSHTATNRKRRKRRKRDINTLPTAKRIITLPPPNSVLHIQTSLLTATHLVLTAPQPWTIPWKTLRHIDITTHTLHRVIAAICLHTSYPLWSNTISTIPQPHSPTIIDQYTAHGHTTTSIDTHLTPPPHSPPLLSQNGRKVRAGER